jgi:hypothetical protein
MHTKEGARLDGVKLEVGVMEFYCTSGSIKKCLRRIIFYKIRNVSRLVAQVHGAIVRLCRRYASDAVSNTICAVMTDTLNLLPHQSSN